MPVQVVVFRAGRLGDVDQLQPARFDQRHRRAADGQFQALGAVAGNLRAQAQAAGQLKFDQVVVAMRVNGHNAAVQLVAGACAQHQAAQQVEIPGVFGSVQDLGLYCLQTLIKPQHPQACHGQPGTPSALAADAALHQGGLRQVVQLVDGIPRRFVADARTFGGGRDRALFGDVLQQGDTLRAADDMLGKQGRQVHEGRFAKRGVPEKCLLRGVASSKPVGFWRACQAIHINPSCPGLE